MSELKGQLYLALFDDENIGIEEIPPDQPIPKPGERPPWDDQHIFLTVIQASEEEREIVDLVLHIDGKHDSRWMEMLERFATLCMRAGQARVIRWAEEQNINLPAFE